jgi:hypothetical protein
MERGGGEVEALLLGGFVAHSGRWTTAAVDDMWLSKTHAAVRRAKKRNASSIRFSGNL